MKINSGAKVKYWYDDPILPTSFTTLDSLEKTVIERFNTSFLKVKEMIGAEEALNN